MSGKYDDIIDLPHPEPQTHPRMPMRDRVCLGGAAAIQAPSRPDKTSGDEAAIRPPNVIKLSKSAHTKKYPPRKIEVGIFYAFVMWFACAYFAGRTMTCPS